MKLIFLSLLLVSVTAFSQDPIPVSRFERDTLYSTTGFKMYNGMVLHIGKGSRSDGKFRFINIKSAVTSEMIENDSVVIEDLRNFGISSFGTAYIELVGRKTFKDGSRGYLHLHIAFETAIESNLYHTPGELIVPEAFIPNTKNTNVPALLEKLAGLRSRHSITKEEYETAKKNLQGNNP